jgi:DHA1 family bicyclomycin/chloramphenicol resistance-like MFS transporter
MMSSLMTVMAVAPLLGPSAGSMILHVGSWRAIFWTLVGLGIMTLASLRLLPETLPPSRRNPQTLSSAFSSYFTLLKHPKVLGYAGTSGCFYGGVYAYIAGSPFAYISFHHTSPETYGILFAGGIIGMMVTNQINSRLVHRLGSDRLMGWGAGLVALSGGALLATSWTGLGGLLGLVVPLCIFISATGLIVANSIVGALNIFPSRAGAVSALLGSIQYGTGMIGSALVGSFANGTPGPMGAVICSMALGSAFSALFLSRLQRVPR